MICPCGVCVGYGEVGAPGRDGLDPMTGLCSVLGGYDGDVVPCWDCCDGMGPSCVAPRMLVYCPEIL